MLCRLFSAMCQPPHRDPGKRHAFSRIRNTNMNSKNGKHLICGQNSWRQSSEIKKLQRLVPHATAQGGAVMAKQRKTIGTGITAREVVTYDGEDMYRQ